MSKRVRETKKKIKTSHILLQQHRMNRANYESKGNTEMRGNVGKQPRVIYLICICMSAMLRIYGETSHFENIHNVFCTTATKPIQYYSVYCYGMWRKGAASDFLLLQSQRSRKERRRREKKRQTHGFVCICFKGDFQKTSLCVFFCFISFFLSFFLRTL